MSTRIITSRPPNRRDAEMLEVIRHIERERQRIGDEQMLDMLNADNLPPLNGETKRRTLRIVAATRGPNRVPQANPPMQGHYDLMRRAIRLVK